MQEYLEAINDSIQALNDDLQTQLGNQCYQLEILTDGLQAIVKQMERTNAELYMIGSVR